MDAVVRSPSLLSLPYPHNLSPLRIPLPFPFLFPSSSSCRPVAPLRCRSGSVSAVPAGGTLILSKNNVYTVGDFMTRKEDLHVVKPNTTIDEALEMLVENRITGFPVVYDDWKLVGLVSDYDLLALDSISVVAYADATSITGAFASFHPRLPLRPNCVCFFKAIS